METRLRQFRVSRFEFRASLLGIVTMVGLGMGRLAWADAPTEAIGAFLQGNTHYKAGHYPEAAADYRAALAGGVESGALYYNLGNALLKSGRRGEALWAYLKAQALSPRDPDVRANLSYVQSLLPASVQASVRPAGWLRALTLDGRYATRELAAAFLLLWWVALLSWMLWSWIVQRRMWLAPPAWVSSLAALVIGVALAAQTAWTDAMPKAVTVATLTEARFAPEPTGTIHFTLPEGAVVRRLHSQEQWVQIRRRDGRGGWVPAESVKTL